MVTAMKTVKKNTWMQKVAGGLDLGVSAFYLLIPVRYIGTLMGLKGSRIGDIDAFVFETHMRVTAAPQLYINRLHLNVPFLGFYIFAAIALLSLLGGIWALKGTKPQLAIAGSVIATFGMPLLGLPASILAVRSKEDWSEKKRAVWIVAISVVGGYWTLQYLYLAFLSFYISRY